MRLDKYLAQTGIGTRSEVKKFIRCGRVLLNGVTAKRPEEKVSQEDEVLVDGKRVIYTEYQYFMLNKPAGVVSATSDKKDTTVVELITTPHAKELFPVGRLDKDTEGLLLLTNDGVLAHELLSPRKHVEKTYFVRVEGLVTKEDIDLFATGMDIGDEKLTRPAKIEIIRKIQSEGKFIGNDAFVISSDHDRYMGEDSYDNGALTELFITITEGRYHQIKRMFLKVNKPVKYLKRVAMGGLKLDENLAVGKFRKLSESEVNLLKRVKIGQ